MLLSTLRFLLFVRLGILEDILLELLLPSQDPRTLILYLLQLSRPCLLHLAQPLLVLAHEVYPGLLALLGLAIFILRSVA